MELKQLLKILRYRWWLILLPLIIVSGYLGLTYQRPATTYQVILRFAAGTEPAGLSEDYDRYYPWVTSEYIANGLADIAETRLFAEAVAARLAEKGLQISASAIQSAIVTDNAQSIVVFYLTWADPQQLVEIATALSAEITLESGTYFPQLDGLGPPLRQLDPPEPHPLTPGLRTQLLGPALRLILAGGVGLALALLAHYFDPTVHERGEIEALEVKILGSIPRLK